MKKSLLIIGIIHAIIISSITTVNAATATATLTPSSTSVKQGDTFTVTLSATCADGINGVYGKEAHNGFGFSYDSTKIELASREAIKLQDQNEDADADTIALMGSSSSFTSGDIYRFTFKVKVNAALGETQISTTDLILDSFAGTNSEIDLGKKSATVTIVSNRTPETPITPEQTIESNNNGGTNNTENNTLGISKPNTTTITTSGKSDTTTATSILPKTGYAAIIGTALITIAIISIVMFKKLKKYDGIK